MPVLFISDLHLQPQRPHISRAFFDLLDNQARTADALYILGDLFDVWISDDEATPLQTEVATALRQLSASGTPVYFVAGNRDFLLGERYARQAGMTLLPDPSVVELYGTRALLMHGDSLCTDDIGYQRYRRFIRSGFFRGLMRLLPLAAGQWIGRTLRGHSDANNTYKSRALMDINRDSAREVLNQHNCRVLIHGHTHRPSCDQIPLGQGGDQPAAERIVLGDWDQKGWLLTWQEDGRYQLTDFVIAPHN